VSGLDDLFAAAVRHLAASIVSGVGMEAGQRIATGLLGRRPAPEQPGVSDRPPVAGANQYRAYVENPGFRQAVARTVEQDALWEWAHLPAGERDTITQWIVSRRPQTDGEVVELIVAYVRRRRFGA
jgi:hypothetical protein